MTTLLFASALSLSSIAAYYAIMGLMAIFSGAATSIAVMGAALEVSKLVVASWLYRNWKQTSLLLKTYFIVAVFILMSLTSMGIFGYLSKAHSDQSLVSGDVQSKIELIDTKISYQREVIDEARKVISQLDAQIEKYTELGAVSRGVKTRDAQRSERDSAFKRIEAAQAEIARLNEERIPYAEEYRKVEAEVGPIKYVAAMLYDNQEAATLEKAVRFMIIMIVIVFDPLAVLMFIAFNQTTKKEEAVVPMSAAAPEVTPIVKDEVYEVEEAQDVAAHVETKNKHIIISDKLSTKDASKVRTT